MGAQGFDFNLDPPDPVEHICTACGEYEDDCGCDEDKQRLITVREFNDGREEDYKYDRARDEGLLG